MLSPVSLLICQIQIELFHGNCGLAVAKLHRNINSCNSLDQVFFLKLASWIRVFSWGLASCGVKEKAVICGPSSFAFVKFKYYLCARSQDGQRWEPYVKLLVDGIWQPWRVDLSGTFLTKLILNGSWYWMTVQGRILGVTHPFTNMSHIIVELLS